MSNVTLRKLPECLSTSLPPSRRSKFATNPMRNWLCVSGCIQGHAQPVSSQLLWDAWYNETQSRFYPQQHQLIFKHVKDEILMTMLFNCCRCGRPEDASLLHVRFEIANKFFRTILSMCRPSVLSAVCRSIYWFRWIADSETALILPLVWNRQAKVRCESKF